MNWYLQALKKYLSFSGRACRKEYWFFALFNLIFSIVLVFLDIATGTFDDTTGIGLSGALYSLGVFLPSIAVSFRRLHDTGRSAWWLLIGLIPLIGAIVLLVFMLLASEPGDNEYGPVPQPPG